MEQYYTATVRNFIAIWVTGKRHDKTVRSPPSLRPGLVYLFSGRVANHGTTVTERWWNFRVKRPDGGWRNVRAHRRARRRRLSTKRYQSVERTRIACVRRTCFRRISALNAATTTKMARADHYHCVCARSDRGPRFRPVVHGTRPGGLYRNYRMAETRTSLFSKIRDIYLFVFNFPRRDRSAPGLHVLVRFGGIEFFFTVKPP